MSDRNREWTTTGRGTNSQGNRWDTRDYGPGVKNENSYHYSNKNGSYYYSNPNGSTYYNDGKGGSTYDPQGAIKGGSNVGGNAGTSAGGDGGSNVGGKGGGNGGGDSGTNAGGNGENKCVQTYSGFVEASFS